MKGFTVLIPAYNESGIIEASIGKVVGYLSGLRAKDYQVLIAENGSVDGTVEKIKKLRKLYGSVDYFSLRKPNLGEALIAGIKAAKYERIIFIPMDLSMNMDFIDESYRLLDGHDMVIGSRRLKGSKVKRSLHREIVGSGFQKMAGAIVSTKVKDTTFVKAFNKSKILPLIRDIKVPYLFDTEVIVRARREKLRVIEIPVTQKDDRPPREKMGRKVARKFGHLSVLRIFLWLERPIFSLGLIGVALFIAGVLCGSYVVVMKYVYDTQMTDLMGMVMLSVLFIISSLLMVILSFLAQMLMTINAKLDRLEENEAVAEGK